MKFLKNFVDWFTLKPKLEKRKNIPLSIKEGEIYWFHCGENIGAEISGKGQVYTRPGIIYKRLSYYLFLVIPTSTQVKKGSWFINFSANNKEQIACLHQIRIIDKKRIYKYLDTINNNDFQKIKEGFTSLYDINPS